MSLCLTAVCGLIISALPASAALIAFDQFDGYTDGNLGGQGQGSGWSGNWGGGLVDSSGLNYAPFPTSGGRALTANTTNQFTGMTRNLASGLTDGTYYIGWLAQRGTSTPTQMWLRLRTSANDQIGAGIWPSSSTQWRLIRNDSGSFGDINSNVAITGSENYFVMKLDLAAGSSDTVRLFVNPTNAGDLINGNADASYTFGGAGINGPLNAVTLSRQNDNSSGGDGQVDQVAFDEIRLGTEAADMFAATPIPEPSTTLLSGLGLMSLVIRRRR